MKYALSVFVCLLLWFSATVASAQPVLERLEKRIRDRVNPPVTGVVPADRGAVQTPASPAAQPAGAQQPKGFQPGYLGVVADDQKDRGRGVRVLDLRPGGPAQKGGLQKNDLINGVAGIRVRQMTDLGDVMALFSAGDALTFDVLRDGKQQQVKITLGRRPTSTAQPEVVPLPVPSPPVGSTVPGAGVPRLNTPQLNGPQVTAKLPTQPGGKKVGSLLGNMLSKLGQTGDKPPEKKPAIKPVPPVQPPVSDAETIKQLRQRVEQLQRRVAELEEALKSKQKLLR